VTKNDERDRKFPGIALVDRCENLVHEERSTVVAGWYAQGTQHGFHYTTGNPAVGCANVLRRACSRPIESFRRSPNPRRCGAVRDPQRPWSRVNAILGRNAEVLHWRRGERRAITPRIACEAEQSAGGGRYQTAIADARAS